MSDTVAAYWGPREETPASAAKRLAELLDAITGAGPAPLAWFEKGVASPQPDDAIEPDRATLEELFATGVNRRDTDRTALPELGYRASLWNGDNSDPVEVSVQAGVTSSTPGVTNSVVVKVPSTPEWRDRAHQLFTALVEIFEPERAQWATREYRRSQTPIGGAAFFGWLTYLTPPWSESIRELPVGVTSEPVATGRILTAGSEPGAESCTLAAALAQQLATDGQR